MLIACEHIDEKNPGTLINALNIVMKAIDHLPKTVEECLGALLEKCMLIVDMKRLELSTMVQKMLGKLLKLYGSNKIVREYLKVASICPAKVKLEVISQMVTLFKDAQV